MFAPMRNPSLRGYTWMVLHQVKNSYAVPLGVREFAKQQPNGLTLAPLKRLFFLQNYGALEYTSIE